jgi:hypothetical protein
MVEVSPEEVALLHLWKRKMAPSFKKHSTSTVEEEETISKITKMTLQKYLKNQNTKN